MDYLYQNNYSTGKFRIDIFMFHHQPNDVLFELNVCVSMVATNILSRHTHRKFSHHLTPTAFAINKRAC